MAHPRVHMIFKHSRARCVCCNFRLHRHANCCKCLSQAAQHVTLLHVTLLDGALESARQSWPNARLTSALQAMSPQ